VRKDDTEELKEILKKIEVLDDLLEKAKKENQ